MLLAQLSPEDNTFIALANPPDLQVSVASSVSPRSAIVDGEESGATIGYTYKFTGKVKQTSAKAYNHMLHVEYFAIGKEIHGDKYILLDHQESTFIPNRENQRSHRVSGPPVEAPNYILEEIHRGLKSSDSLIIVTDSLGETVAYKSSAKWLYDYRDNLRTMLVGRYMDETCNRVAPTGPKRTRY